MLIPLAGHGFKTCLLGGDYKLFSKCLKVLKIAVFQVNFLKFWKLPVARGERPVCWGEGRLLLKEGNGVLLS